MTVLFSDSGAGSNANPIGGSYVTITGWGGAQRTSDTIANDSGSNTDSGVRINVPTDNDHYCQCTIPTLGGRDCGVMVRVQSGSAGGVLSTDYDGANLESYLVVAGVYDIKDRDVGTYATNSVLRTEVVGSNYTVKIDGVTINSFTDATFASGQAGLFLYDGAARFANVEVGNFLAASLNVYDDPAFSRENRPGRGPYSKGAYRRPSLDAFPVAVPVQIVVTTLYKDPSFSRENRPGRGPYSRDKYFRPSLDVFQDAGQILSAAAVSIGASIGSNVGAAAIGASSGGIGASAAQSAAFALLSAAAQSVASSTGADSGILFVSGMGQASGAAQGSVSGSEFAAAIAQSVGSSSGQALAAEVVAAIAQACGVSVAVFSQTTGSIITGAAYSISASLAGSVAAQMSAQPAEGISPAFGAYPASEIVRAVAAAIADTPSSAAAAQLALADARAIAASAAVFSQTSVNIVSGAAVGFSSGLGSCAPVMLISASAQSNADGVAQGIASSLARGAASGSSCAIGSPAAAVVLGANAQAVGESLARAISQSRITRVRGMRVIYLDAHRRVIVVGKSGSKLN